MVAEPEPASRRWPLVQPLVSPPSTLAPNARAAQVARQVMPVRVTVDAGVQGQPCQMMPHTETVRRGGHAPAMAEGNAPPLAPVAAHTATAGAGVLPAPLVSSEGVRTYEGPLHLTNARTLSPVEMVAPLALGVQGAVHATILVLPKVIGGVPVQTFGVQARTCAKRTRGHTIATKSIRK